ncbi:response regulator transcription factor [Agriterribacter sp.]|uniref:response regulator transcription factor n=1 Tax=Agriterribacter sp. TaxID=2821509 RepID=UPI002BF38FC3|nr:response regulator transcription factor [Agriterribacter sp.]HRP56052.1 response regulator transcription factor [Agriterribacter sp.]
MKIQDSEASLNVVIADDHVLFRAGVKTALSLKKDIRIIGEADNGQQLLHLLKHLQPDVILLDIQMPVMDGITALPEIKKLYPQIRIIMLTMHNDHSMISRLMELGANAYLTKNSDSEVIYEAIKTCYTNEYYFNELTNKALLDGLRTKRNADAFAPAEVKLSDKEKHILKLMCDEKSTKEIADMVDLSPRTVEAIRDKLKSKTGVKSMAGLVIYAIKSGIIENK